MRTWSSFIGKGPNSYDLGYSAGEQSSGYALMLINAGSGDDEIRSYVKQRVMWSDNRGGAQAKGS